MLLHSMLLIFSQASPSFQLVNIFKVVQRILQPETHSCH